ncbi:MAG: hypothetical protein PWQ82_570 [Thermosediminibacterales bacterium]|nr:hypothetical protein [Thermosediminibacterales bacterium]MDK2835496.1 hypothetical protein [Thermosediminibacterales bacterium]
MNFASILLLALAISIDGFATGVTYGLRNIKIPLLSLIIIDLATVIALATSMAFGRWFSLFFPFESAKTFGATMLIVLGIMIVFKSYFSEIRKTDETKTLANLQIKHFGIVINILIEPMAADMDVSGSIDSKEAWFLGTALALDAFGAGFGAAVARFNLVFTILIVGLINFIAVITGLNIGINKRFINLKVGSSLISGTILILIGVLKLF